MQTLSKQKKNNIDIQYKFMGLLALFTIAENPNQYNIAPYELLVYKITFGLIFLGIILFFLRDVLSRMISTLFVHLLNNYFFQRLVCHYCYIILLIKGFFELEHILLPIFFGAPNIIFLVNVFVNGMAESIDCFYLMIFWFSLGVTLLSWNQLAIRVTNFLSNEPDHLFSKLFSQFLIERSHSRFKPLLQAGGIPGLGKLSAAGQAAVFTGVATMVTGISISGLNIWYNIRKDNLTAQKEDKDRQAKAVKDSKKYAYKAAENDKDRAYKAAENDKNRAQQEQHWAAKVAAKEKARQQEEDKKKNSSWFSKK